jgi:ketosteroid isomerase-like protein
LISPEDIDRIRDGYRLVNQRQVMTDFLADDFLLEQTPGLPGTRGAFRGAAGMEASMNELLTGFDAFRFDPVSFDVHGEWVVVPIKFWASARGFEHEIDIIHLWHIRHGQAQRLRVLTGDADPVEEIRKLTE